MSDDEVYDIDHRRKMSAKDNALLYCELSDIDKKLFRAKTAEETKYALEHGANVNAYLEKVGTPLITAAQEGDIERMKVLIDYGADVNACADDANKTTALMVTQTAEQAELLIKNGANVDKEDWWNGTAVMFALRDNNLEKLNVLIKAGANLNLGDNHFGLLPLSAAITEQQMDILLASGADVNARGYSFNAQSYCGDTPLMASIRDGNEMRVKRLVNAGADVNAKDEDGCTALMLAIRQGNKRGNYDLAKLLINSGADVSAKDKNGEKALDYTSKAEMKRLLEYAERKQEYDREGLKVDNWLANARKKTAGAFGLENIEIPDWMKKAEAKLSKAIEGKEEKKARKPVDPKVKKAAAKATKTTQDEAVGNIVGSVPWAINYAKKRSK